MTTVILPEEKRQLMAYNRLGNTGLHVSELAYGSWITFKNQLNVDSAYELMKLAFDHGVNYFDNSETYAHGEAETIMGQCVEKGIIDNVWKRSDLVLSTKLYFGDGSKGPNQHGLSRKHLIEGMQGSLKRINLDYYDVVFCNRPDPETPIEETVRAMNFLIDNGMAFYWGTSEWSADSIQQACDIADKLLMQKPSVEQPEYNLFTREKVEAEYTKLFEKMGLGAATWSPLASGVLTGKYNGQVVPAGSRLSLPECDWLQKEVFDPENKWKISKAEEIKRIAKRLGCTNSQLCLAWCMHNPNVSTVIMGATTVLQMEENLGALNFKDLITTAYIEDLDVILKTKPAVNKSKHSFKLPKHKGLIN